MSRVPPVDVRSLHERYSTGVAECMRCRAKRYRRSANLEAELRSCVGRENKGHGFSRGLATGGPFSVHCPNESILLDPASHTGRVAVAHEMHYSGVRSWRLSQSGSHRAAHHIGALTRPLVQYAAKQVRKSLFTIPLREIRRICPSRAKRLLRTCLGMFTPLAPSTTASC